MLQQPLLSTESQAGAGISHTSEALVVFQLFAALGFQSPQLRDW